MMEAQSNNTKALTGKVALVTGGGTGIGRAAALGFARKGATVVVVGRRQAELRAVVGEIEGMGGTAAAITADIANEGEVTSLIKRVVERFGRLDAAFNNAATSNGGPIESLTTADFDSFLPPTSAACGWPKHSRRWRLQHRWHPVTNHLLF